MEVVTPPLLRKSSEEEVDKSKDVDRYLKFFLIKAAQVIVGSRGGQGKVKTGCAGGANEWFNITIPDTQIPQLIPFLPPGNTPITIATTLTPPELPNQKVTLETWTFQVTKPEAKIKDVFTIYNRLGVLLKSLICTTRATPAYKIARKDVKLECSFSNEELDASSLLGEKFKTVTIGKMDGVENFVEVRLDYRVKMEFFESFLVKSSLMGDVKEDHFGGEHAARRAAGGIVRAAFCEGIEWDEREEEDLDGDGEFVLFGLGRGKRTEQQDKDKSSTATPQQESPASSTTSPKKTVTSPTTASSPQQGALPTRRTTASTISAPPLIVNLPFASTSSIFASPLSSQPHQQSSLDPTSTTTTSSTSSTELLTLFEEFRIAPPLHFPKPEEPPKLEEELQTFENEAKQWEEWVEKLE